MTAQRDILQRNEAEKAFHDTKFSRQPKPSYYAEGFLSVVFEDFVRKMGPIENLRVLELGCGDGWFTKLLASKGAEVSSCDISEEAVRKARDKFAAVTFKHPIRVDQMAAEKLLYPDSTFDLVVGSAILHHVDLVAGLREVKRVLKDGGRALFMEPLGHNPLLNVYRHCTPHLRSRDETPLRREHYAQITQIFPGFRSESYFLTATFALAFHFLRMKGLMIRARDLLWRLDRKLLAWVPGAGKYCWYAILSLEK